MDKVCRDVVSCSLQLLQADFMTMVHSNEFTSYKWFPGGGSTDPFPLPECYYHQLVTDEHGGLLIMEDFTSRAACVNLFDGLTVKQL